MLNTKIIYLHHEVELELLIPKIVFLREGLDFPKG